MKGLEIKKRRIKDCVELMDFDKVKFFTLTTPDVVSLEEIRKRWRRFRHYLVEKLGKVKYVMNYELHPKGHGWHIHILINRFVNLRDNDIRGAIIRCGFGRVDISSAKDCFSLSEYVSKHCIKSYKTSFDNVKRLRLVNCSRGLFRLSDYDYKSEFLEDIRKIYKAALSSCIYRQFKNITLYRASKNFVLFQHLGLSFEDCLHLSHF